MLLPFLKVELVSCILDKANPIENLQEHLISYRRTISFEGKLYGYLYWYFFRFDTLSHNFIDKFVVMSLDGAN